MSDDASEASGLPAIAARQSLTIRKDSLARRGLELVLKSAETSQIARTELAAARHFCDLADRLLSGPNTWDQTEGRFLELPDKRVLIDKDSWPVYARHCRDANRHVLGAIANHFQMEFGEPIDFANRLARRHAEDPLLFPRGLPDLLPVAYFEQLVTPTYPGVPEPRELWERLGAQEPALWWSLQRLFIEDAAELIEHGAVGVVLLSGLNVAACGIEQAKIVRWFKTVGESVVRGEALFEILSMVLDVKASSPVLDPTVILSPAVGRLVAILVEEGETVPSSNVVALIYTL